jgi:hypothetical protein
MPSVASYIKIKVTEQKTPNYILDLEYEHEGQPEAEEEFGKSGTRKILRNIIYILRT